MFLQNSIPELLSIAFHALQGMKNLCSIVVYLPDPFYIIDQLNLLSSHEYFCRCVFAKMATRYSESGTQVSSF